MGCLSALIKTFFEMLYYAFVAFIWIFNFLFMIIKAIIKLIIKTIKNKNNKNIKYNTQYVVSKTEPQPILKDYSYLKIYINKKHTGLRKNNELNYKLLGLESYDAPNIYYDEYAEVKGYNVFTAEEYSSEKYGDILNRLNTLCEGDFYATIKYNEDKVAYRITIKDNNIHINNNNVQFMKNRYSYLKNKITSFTDRLLDYFTYIEDDDFYYNVVPNEDLDCDSISELSDKLKKTNEILMFEIPYMEEIATIIDIIEPKIKNEYQKYKNKEFDSIPGFKVIEEEIQDEDIIINKTNKKELSWREQEFEKEAQLWGLSEEDKSIAKEEGMTPAEFVEAEEYDDDELTLDEWER